MLWRIPITQLIQTLAIQIPKVPIVAITQVTNDTISFHWEPTIDNGHYEVYLNGAQVGIALPSQSSCVFKNLRQNSFYQLDVIAVFVTNFRSKSSTVYFRTHRSRGKFNTHETPQSIATFLTKDQEVETVTHKNPGNNTLRSRSNTLLMVGTPMKNSLSNETNHANNNIKSDKKELEKRMEVVKKLKKTLEAGQEDLTNIAEQQIKQMQEFNQLFQEQIKERDRRREIKESGERTRKSIKSEFKLLENNFSYSTKEKDSISFEFSKLEKEWKLKNDDLKKWAKELKLMEERNNYINTEGPDILKSIGQNISKLNDKLNGLKQENSNLEKQLIVQSSKRRTKFKEYEEISLLIKEISKEKPKSSKELTILNKIQRINPEIYSSIKTEIDIDNNLINEFEIERKEKVELYQEKCQRLESIKGKLESLTKKKMDRTLENINKTASQREEQQKLQQQLFEQHLQEQKLSQLFPTSANTSTSIFNNTNPVINNSGAPSFTDILLNNDLNLLNTNQSNNDILLQAQNELTLLAQQQNDNLSLLSQPPPPVPTYFWQANNNDSETQTKLRLDTTNIDQLEAEMNSATVQNYIPANLLDNNDNETNFLKDINRFTFGEARNSSEISPNISNSILRTATDNSHVRNASGFISMGSTDMNLSFEQHSSNSPFIIDTSNNNQEQNNHHSTSLSSTFSPKKLFNFSRKQPSFSGSLKSQFDTDTEMITNSDTFFMDNNNNSNNNNTSRFFGKKNSVSSETDTSTKGVSRFFGKKSDNNHNNDNNEQSSPQLPSLQVTDDSDTTNFLNELTAPSLRGRDRSGSINSGSSMPQSFHTAQINLNPWVNTNQSNTSLLYPTTSTNNLPIRGPSLDNDRLLATMSHDSIEPKESTNSWSLFHIKKNNNNNNNNDSVPPDDTSSPFIDETMVTTPKNRGMLFFRREKEKHESSPLALNLETANDSTEPSTPNDIASPSTQKKRKSIFSFSKSNNQLFQQQNHQGSNSSLDNTVVDDSNNNEEDEDEESNISPPEKSTSSKTSKLFPKSMRGLGITRRSSTTSTVITGISTGSNTNNNNNNQVEENASITNSSAKSTEKISSILE